jgi:hypothetical protein
MGTSFDPVVDFAAATVIIRAVKACRLRDEAVLRSAGVKKLVPSLEVRHSSPSHRRLSVRNVWETFDRRIFKYRA